MIFSVVNSIACFSLNKVLRNSEKKMLNGKNKSRARMPFETFRVTISKVTTKVINPMFLNAQ